MKALLGVFALLSLTTLAAEEIRVMSAGAVESGLAPLASEFAQERGHRVTIAVGTAPQLTSRLDANEAADVLVAPATVMEAAVAAARVDTSTLVTVGRVGVGIVIRRGAPAPDVSSADALRRALLDTKAVVYNRGSTGQYVDGLLLRLGVGDQVARKAVRFDTGEQVMERLAAGTGSEVGFGAIPDIRLREAEGVQFVAPLPAGIQNFTTYQAAVLRVSRAPAVAAAFLTHITTLDARRRLSGAGIEGITE